MFPPSRVTAVVLAPQSTEGTPQSVHDRRDTVSPTGGQAELSAPSVHTPPIPASSGVVRRLVLVQDVQNVASVDMTMVDRGCPHARNIHRAHIRTGEGV